MNIFLTSNWLCYIEWINAAKLIKYFQQNNCAIVKKPEQADCIILITCSWHKSREGECFRLIERFKKYRAKLIVLGCLPGFAPKKFSQRFKGDYLLPKDYLNIGNLFKEFRVSFSDIPEINSFPIEFLSMSKKISIALGLLIYKASKLKPILKKEFIRGLQSVFKKYPISYFIIASGCRNNCSFCVAHRSTGTLKSKQLENCVEEYRGLIQKGFKNFIIVAQDTGSYGLDIGRSFPELMERLDSIDNSKDIHWHLDGMNPKWIIKYKEGFKKQIESGRIKTIITPIQSGSNRILKLMNRNYKIADLIECLKNFKSCYSGLIIKTHIIVGFPSETEQDFAATLETIKKVKFNHVFIHPYCDREKSYSSSFNQKIPQQIISQRTKKARRLVLKMKINNILRYKI